MCATSASARPHRGREPGDRPSCSTWPRSGRSEAWGTAGLVPGLLHLQPRRLAAEDPQEEAAGTTRGAPDSACFSTHSSDDATSTGIDSGRLAAWRTTTGSASSPSGENTTRTPGRRGGRTPRRRRRRRPARRRSAPGAAARRAAIRRSRWAGGARHPSQHRHVVAVDDQHGPAGARAWRRAPRVVDPHARAGTRTLTRQRGGRGAGPSLVRGAASRAARRSRSSDAPSVRASAAAVASASRSSTPAPQREEGRGVLALGAGRARAHGRVARRHARGRPRAGPATPRSRPRAPPSRRRPRRPCAPGCSSTSRSARGSRSRRARRSSFSCSSRRAAVGSAGHGRPRARRAPRRGP